MSDILQDSTVVQRSVPVHGSTQLGLRSHPPGSIKHEAPTTTFSFIKSNKPVYSTVSIRLLSSFHRNEAMEGPIVSHIRNPYPTISGGIRDFHGRLYPVLGRSHGGFPDCGCLDPLHISVLELKAVILGHHVMIATDNTIVPYINKQCGTHSHSLLRQVVDLFLWL